MRRFYHFHREKRSVRSPNPLRAPAQSTAFSNRRFNRRAAQNRSSSDSTQTHLQNHAASASQLSTYKASCAGFTTLLRFSIKPCAALNSHASARTPFKNHRRTKLLSIRFRASPATLCHPAHPAPDSPHSSASASNPAPLSTLTHPRERPSKNIAAQSRSPFDSVQPHLQNHAASASQLSTYKASCAGFTTLLRFGIKPCAALNSHASAQTYFKKHRRTKPLSLRFRASPATLCHPAHPAPDSPHSFALHQIPQSPYNARQSAPALPHARGITGNLSAGGQKNRRTRLDAAVDVTFQAAIRPARRST